MTLVSTIIRDAYRESNLISISADPTAAEADEGLRFLNRLVLSVYGTEAGEELSPILIGRHNIERPTGYPFYDQVPDQTDWFVPDNAQLVLNLTSPQTVYLSPTPDDGSRFAYIDKSGNIDTYPLTIYGNGKTILSGNSLVANTADDYKQFFYRADVANWQVLTPLEADDDFPFPPEFDDLFIIDLSMRLNPRHATETDPQSSQRYLKVLKAFKSRYRQHQQMGSELGLIRTPGNKNRYYDDTRFANSLFNSGRAYPFGGYGW